MCKPPLAYIFCILAFCLTPQSRALGEFCLTQTSESWLICASAEGAQTVCYVETITTVMDIGCPLSGYTSDYDTAFSQTGGGGGGGTSISLTDVNGDGVVDCWNQLTTDSSAPISSPFGPRTHPVTGVQSDHNGIDIAVPTGTKVFSGKDGVVVELFDGFAPDAGTGNGNFVRINYADGTQGVYLHLESVGINLSDQVQQGQYIGTSNNTGTSSGPHLHYSIWKDKDHATLGQSATDISNFDNPENIHGSCSP